MSTLPDWPYLLGGTLMVVLTIFLVVVVAALPIRNKK